MKDFRGMKRQRSRNRKPSGNSNNPNRAYESNGPEGTKVRGNAQTIYEKYQQLARDANSSGDRVLAENHLQHAEHYFRLIRQMQPQRPVSEFVQRDPFSNGFDFDDEDLENEGNEGEAEAATGGDESQPVLDEARYDGQRNGNDRNNGERSRNDRNNGERNRDRDRNNGDRNNGNRDNRNFENRDRNNGERSNGERNNGDRNMGGDRYAAAPTDGEGLDGRRETRRERYERRRAQRLNDQEQNPNGGYAPTSEVAAPSYIAPTEPLNARPAAPQPAPVSDADHLPAFLRTPTPVAAPAPEPVAETAADEAPKPRRGRPKRKAEEAAAEEA